MLLTAPVAAVALVALPFGRSIFVLVITAFAFYLAYFTYYAPYRALYSDVVPAEQAGRAQGIQGVFRGAGMGSALVAGALLLQLWRPLPYVVAAAVLLATTLAAVLGLRRERPRTDVPAPASSAAAEVWSLIRDHRDIRRFLAANVLWQITEGGLKSFIVLYLRRGIHKSFTFSALAMGVVAVGALVASPLAGKLADRYGAVRVMRVSLWVFGVGLWLPTFSRADALLLPVLPVVGVGGVMALALPYAILMRMMPRGSHGAAAGLFDVSSGAGALLGPLLTGAAIDVLHPLFAQTGGYAAMWPVIGTSTLLSIALLRGEARATGEEG